MKEFFEKTRNKYGGEEETLDTFDKDELTIAHIKLYKSLEGTIDAVTGVMLDSDKPLDEVKAWNKSKKDEVNVTCEFKNKVKQKLSE